MKKLMMVIVMMGLTTTAMADTMATSVVYKVMFKYADQVIEYFDHGLMSLVEHECTENFYPALDKMLALSDEDKDALRKEITKSPQATEVFRSNLVKGREAIAICQSI